MMKYRMTGNLSHNLIKDFRGGTRIKCSTPTFTCSLSENTIVSTCNCYLHVFFKLWITNPHCVSLPPSRQAVLIAVLVKVGAIPETWEGPQEKLQNFVVVVEMLLFAVAHYFIFSHKPYIDPAAAEVPCITTCLRMLDVRDVAGDVKEHFVDPIPRPRFKIRNMLNGSSTTGSDEENGGMAVQENSPLLKKAKISELRPSTSSTLGAVAHSEDSRSDTEGVSGQTRSRQQQQLSELSYDVLTYKEFDNRTGYGLRARMIASAAASLGVVDETKDSTTPSSSEGKSSSSSSSAVTSDTEKEVTSLK